MRAALQQDPALAEHGNEVGRRCVVIGERMGLAASHLRRLKVAGTLHDVGKLWISRRILDKPGSLDDEEWRQVRMHPSIGAALLRQHALPEVAEWVLAHHERPDGRGYPRGLAGDAIPMGARIIAVADAFDAMISPRPYCPAMPRSAAVGELQAGIGAQFDRDVVVSFLAALSGEPVAG